MTYFHGVYTNNSKLAPNNNEIAGLTFHWQTQPQQTNKHFKTHF